MSKCQVLVAAMHQKDFSIVENMNLSTDAIIANQDDSYSYQEQEYTFGTVKMITTNQRGVGKNRNVAFNLADGDILLISDEDVRYVDNYAELVKSEFEKTPQADMIIFNIHTIGDFKYRRENSTVKRIRLINALNYGAVRIAVKREILEKTGTYFSLNFGGGAIYSAGEDSIFIADMLRKNVKIYTSPVVIADVDQSTSTWFKGYTHKYFYDKGALFRALFGRLAYLFFIQDYVRHYKKYKDSELSTRDAIHEIIQGIIGYKSYAPYCEQ